MRYRFILAGIFSGLLTSTALAQTLPDSEGVTGGNANRIAINRTSSVITPGNFLASSQDQSGRRRGRIREIREKLRKLRRRKPASP